MDGLTIIHAKSNRDEIGVLTDVLEADMEISIAPDADLIDNTWSVTVSEGVWEADPITEGDYVYIPGTEWGGPVTFIRHSTGDRTVTVQGVTWRGLLFQRRIEPPAGEGYLVIEDEDVNEVIADLVEPFGAVFSVPDAPSGATISARWRYQTVAGGLHQALRAGGQRLIVRYDQITKSAALSAGPVSDLSDEIEISQDYGVDFTSAVGQLEFANHCLALGSGELAARTVLNVYRDLDGSYVTERPESLTDAEIRTVLLDYPNAESAEELLKSAVQRLAEHAPEQTITVNELLVNAGAELGDIVGVRDRLTGLEAKSEIVQKILTVKDGRVNIDAKVG